MKRIDFSLPDNAYVTGAEFRPPIVLMYWSLDILVSKRTYIYTNCHLFSYILEVSAVGYIHILVNMQQLEASLSIYKRVWRRLWYQIASYTQGRTFVYYVYTHGLSGEFWLYLYTDEPNSTLFCYWMAVIKNVARVRGITPCAWRKAYLSLMVPSSELRLRYGKLSSTFQTSIAVLKTVANFACSKLIQSRSWISGWLIPQYYSGSWQPSTTELPAESIAGEGSWGQTWTHLSWLLRGGTSAPENTRILWCALHTHSVGSVTYLSPHIIFEKQYCPLPPKNLISPWWYGRIQSILLSKMVLKTDICIHYVRRIPWVYNETWCRVGAELNILGTY